MKRNQITIFTTILIKKTEEKYRQALDYLARVILWSKEVNPLYDFENKIYIELEGKQEISTSEQKRYHYILEQNKRLQAPEIKTKILFASEDKANDIREEFFEVDINGTTYSDGMIYYEKDKIRENYYTKYWKDYIFEYGGKPMNIKYIRSRNFDNEVIFEVVII